MATVGSAFEESMESIVNDILSKEENLSEDQVSNSHLLWLRREATKLMRNEIALAEKESRLLHWENSLKQR